MNATTHTTEVARTRILQLGEEADRFRSPHLWRKEDGEWKLRHQVE